MSPKIRKREKTRKKKHIKKDEYERAVGRKWREENQHNHNFFEASLKGKKKKE